MKFQNYVNMLQELLKMNPELAEYETIYAEDDEGNGYDIVGFGPTIGHYNKDDKEFSSDPEDLAEYELEFNAVCIN